MAFFTYAFAEPLEKICVGLNWIPNAEFAGILYAIKKGYYHDEGLDIEINSDRVKGSDLTDLIVTKKCDIGLDVGSVILNKRNAGVKIKAFAAGMQMTPITVMSLKEKGIEHLSDLKGKRFGYYSQSDIDILKILLSENYLNINDVTLKKISLAYDDLINDNIDALFAYEINQPIIFGLENKQVNLIYARNNGFVFYGSVFFATDDLVLSYLSCKFRV